MENRDPRRIVAAVRDLFFAVRIKDTLQPQGYEVAIVKSAAALDSALASPAASPAVLLVDLNFRALDPPATIARLKADPATRAIPILAFGSHLDHAARDAARAAGADRVVANSQLADDLPGLVARVARRQAQANG
jgi:CheY-like chemotaxis protein